MRLIYKHKTNNTQSTGCQAFTTLPSFKNKLKTFLFSEYFNWVTLSSPWTVIVCVCVCVCVRACACACHWVCNVYVCMPVLVLALYTFTKLSLMLEQVHIIWQLWLVKCKLMTIYVLMYLVSALLYCSTPWARGMVHMKFWTWSWRLSYQLLITNKVKGDMMLFIITTV